MGEVTVTEGEGGEIVSTVEGVKNVYEGGGVFENEAQKAWYNEQLIKIKNDLVEKGLPSDDEHVIQEYRKIWNPDNVSSQVVKFQKTDQAGTPGGSEDVLITKRVEKPFDFWKKSGAPSVNTSDPNWYKGEEGKELIDYLWDVYSKIKNGYNERFGTNPVGVRDRQMVSKSDLGFRRNFDIGRAGSVGEGNNEFTHFVNNYRSDSIGVKDQIIKHAPWMLVPSDKEYEDVEVRESSSTPGTDAVIGEWEEVTNN